MAMHTHTTPAVLSASSICSDSVRNPQGDELGNIKELMIDVASGRVAYAVLSFGGFLGMGDKLFAVPWPALTLDAENHQFILQADKEKLKEAPGFDKDHWPKTGETEWHAEVHSFYGVDPYWSEPHAEPRSSMPPR